LAARKRAENCVILWHNREKPNPQPESEDRFRDFYRKRISPLPKVPGRRQKLVLKQMST